MLFLVLSWFFNANGSFKRNHMGYQFISLWHRWAFLLTWYWCQLQPNKTSSNHEINTHKQDRKTFIETRMPVFAAGQIQALFTINSDNNQVLCIRPCITIVSWLLGIPSQQQHRQHRQNTAARCLCFASTDTTIHTISYSLESFNYRVLLVPNLHLPVGRVQIRSTLSLSMHSQLRVSTVNSMRAGTG